MASTSVHVQYLGSKDSQGDVNDYMPREFLSSRVCREQMSPGCRGKKCHLLRATIAKTIHLVRMNFSGGWHLSMELRTTLE